MNQVSQYFPNDFVHLLGVLLAVAVCGWFIINWFIVKFRQIEEMLSYCDSLDDQSLTAQELEDKFRARMLRTGMSTKEVEEMLKWSKLK